MGKMKPTEMSPLTRKLFEYECLYVQKANPIAANFIGRVITLIVTMSLHAIMICTAVKVCFSTIKEMLTNSDERLLRMQKRHCILAYEACITSFCAIFNQKLLKTYEGFSPRFSIHLSPRGPGRGPFTRLRLPEPIEEYVSSQNQVDEAYEEVSSVSSVEEYDEEETALSTPVEIPSRKSSFEEVAAVPEERGGSLENNSPLTITEDPEVRQMLDEYEKTKEDDCASESSSESNTSDLVLELTGFVPSQGQKEENPYIVLKHPSERVLVGSLPPTPEKASPRDFDDEKFEGSSVRTRAFEDPISDFDVQEQFAIQLARKREQKRIETLAEERRPKNDREAMTRLAKDLQDAQKQLLINDNPFCLETAPEHHYQDSKWIFAEHNLAVCSVGICQYIPNPLAPRAVYFVDQFQVKIGEILHNGHLLSLVAPEKGQRAARYFNEKFPFVLQKNLAKASLKGVSVGTIYSAISTSFTEINDDFLENVLPMLPKELTDQRASATVILFFADALWTAHLGQSRALMNNDSCNLQLTEYPNPESPKYRLKAENLGGEVVDGRVNGLYPNATGFAYPSNSAVSSEPVITRIPLEKISMEDCLFVGTQGFFELTSTNNLAESLKAERNKKLEAPYLAHDVVYSAQRKKNSPLTCFVVKFNPSTQEDGDWCEL